MARLHHIVEVTSGIIPRPGVRCTTAALTMATHHPLINIRHLHGDVTDEKAQVGIWAAVCFSEILGWDSEYVVCWRTSSSHHHHKSDFCIIIMKVFFEI